MGSSMFTEQSDSIYQNKKYSQTEIRDRIQQLINKNNKSLSETSMNTLPDLNNSITEHNLMEHHNYIPSISVEYNSQHGGRKFDLNKKRYKQYDIKKYINKINQNGGDINITSDDYQQLSNFSEFDKIREYMISQMKSEGKVEVVGGYYHLLDGKVEILH